MTVAIRTAILLLVLLAEVQAATYNVKTLGAKGDGRTDDYDAILRAVDLINRDGGGTLYFPAGTYRVARVVREDGYGRSLNGLRHFHFRNVRNLNISGEAGARISVKGDFHKRADASIGGFRYSYDHQVSFIFSSCRDVRISRLEINGNCDRMTIEPGVMENIAYGFLFGHAFSDANHSVRIEDVWIHHMSTDGMSWKGGGGGLAAKRLRCTNNGRCGLSIVQGKNMRFEDCEFSGTGFGIGRYGGHATGTGVDIENETATDIEDIRFDNCRFVGNRGGQFWAQDSKNLPHKGATRRISLERCHFEDPTAAVEVPERTVFLTAEASSITSSTIIGTLNFDVLGGPLPQTQQGRGVLVKNCVIRTSGYGVRSTNTHRFTMEGCTVEQTGRRRENGLGVNFPFILGNPKAVVRNNTFVLREDLLQPDNPGVVWDSRHMLLGAEEVANNRFVLLPAPATTKGRMTKATTVLLNLRAAHASGNSYSDAARIKLNQ